ncbi:hypothetical protein RB195_022456 [Necator americanus]|uniref:Mos1 transposase HTH domain-containing protein n=2 Tax=Necator americanus TaxID=51031 RepID=A0ABR1EFL2_NECAM
MRMRTCLLCDFKQGTTVAEPHRDVSKAFGDDVISERQCCNWFQRFGAGDESLQQENRGRQSKIIDNDALKTAAESNPSQATRELAEIFGCGHMTFENHRHRFGKVNRWGKCVSDR